MPDYFKRRPKTTLLVGILAAVAAAVAAYAAWTWSQSTTTPRGHTAGTPVLTFSSPTTGDYTSECVPGGSCSVYVNVTNPSTVDVQLTSWQATSTNSWDSSGCAAGANGYGGPIETTNTQTLATPIDLPAGATTLVELPNAISLSSTASTACENAEITSSGGAQITFGFSVGS